MGERVRRTEFFAARKSMHMEIWYLFTHYVCVRAFTHEL